MPIVIQGSEFSPTAVSNINTQEQKFDYDYPQDLGLKPGSELHERIKTEVLNRARESYHVMSRRYAEWNKIDRTLTSFIEQDEDEKKVKDNDERRPTSIVVPISYAMLDTMLSYWVAAFLDYPYFRYEGFGPEDTIGAILMEKSIESHCRRMKVGLQLYTMFRDALVYGMGIVSPVWRAQYGMKPKNNPPDTGIGSLFSKLIGTQETSPEREIKFEGNKLINIDPYDYLPDPNVSIHNVQEGEYVGWIDRDNLMNLLELDQNDDKYFNVRYLMNFNYKRSSIVKGDNDVSGRSERWGGTERLGSQIHTNPVDVIYQYVNLIPKRWGLGESEYPEKWYFALAADEVVIIAQPLGLNHNRFPIAVNSPNFDGYGSTPVSALETIYGLQGTIDWFFSSHIANVRKSMNDMFVVDPQLVNIHDVKRPGPGKLIRLRRSAWGKNKVQEAIQQLSVQDVTSNNVGDVGVMMGLINKVLGVDDPLQGILNRGGERKTATEVRGAKQGGISRIEKSARICSMQAMDDIAYLFAEHTQQFMTRDLFVKTTGDWEKVLRAEYTGADKVPVTPQDIDVAYDIITKDGSVPSSDNANTWLQLLQLVAQDPKLSQQVDTLRVFKSIARKLGEKNVNDFIGRDNDTQLTPEVEGEEVVNPDVNLENPSNIGT